MGRSLDAPEVNDATLPTGIVAMVESRGIVVRMAYPPEANIDERRNTFNMIMQDCKENAKQDGGKKVRVAFNVKSALILGVGPASKDRFLGIMIRVLYSYGYKLQSKDLGVYIFALDNQFLDTKAAIDSVADAQNEIDTARDLEFAERRIETASPDELDQIIKNLGEIDGFDMSDIEDELEQAESDDLESIRQTLLEVMDENQDDLNEYFDDQLYSSDNDFEWSSVSDDETIMESDTEDEGEIEYVMTAFGPRPRRKQ